MGGNISLKSHSFWIRNLGTRASRNDFPAFSEVAPQPLYL